MITHYSVGGYPRKENDAYWVICHPAGTKRWCWTSGYRDRVIENFRLADEATSGLDFNTVSERTAFEIALLAVERDSEFNGSLLDENGKGGV
jgi:histidinol phosphatase-like PHP family hydrolase